MMETGQPRQPTEQEKLEAQHLQQTKECISLGEEARLFLTSDLARYINNHAELKLLDAQKRLGVVDPTDLKKIVRLQIVVGQFNHYERCLEELVTAGDLAYQEYLAQQHND